VSVTKTTGADVYSVRNAGEWATIVVREWSERREDGTEWPRGEILINSTFGSWSQYWNAPGVRFRQFLVGLDFDYVFDRFMGRALHQFDGDKSVEGLKRDALKLRRKRWLSRKAARLVFDEIDENISTESVEGFINGCAAVEQECGALWNENKVRPSELDDIRSMLSEPWCRTETRYNPAALGFWRDLWPEFVAALRAELAESKEAQPCAN